MDKLITMREQALEERKKSQGRMIKEALDEKRISPKTFDIQLRKLEKWVTKEKEELKQRKHDIEKGWKGTYDTVMRTQRDLMFMARVNNAVLANSFSHEHIPRHEHIKIIDNFHSDSMTII